MELTWQDIRQASTNTNNGLLKSGDFIFLYDHDLLQISAAPNTQISRRTALKHHVIHFGQGFVRTINAQKRTHNFMSPNYRVYHSVIVICDPIDGQLKIAESDQPYSKISSMETFYQERHHSRFHIFRFCYPNYRYWSVINERQSLVEISFPGMIAYYAHMYAKSQIPYFNLLQTIKGGFARKQYNQSTPRTFEKIDCGTFVSMMHDIAFEEVYKRNSQLQNYTDLLAFKSVCPMQLYREISSRSSWQPIYYGFN